MKDAYKKVADERKDICGMTLLASRTVAILFVGALAAVLALSSSCIRLTKAWFAPTRT